MNRNIRFALAGLETGISGSLAMLGWLAAASLWSRRTIWWVPNLIASVFFREASLRYGFGKPSLAGLALVLFSYGAIGTLFGLIWREQQGAGRALLTALAVSLAAYFLLFRVLWKAFDPLASPYTPDRQILIGHFIYGLVLSRYVSVRAALIPSNN